MNEQTMYGLAGMAFVIILIALAVVLIIGLMKVWQTKIKTTKEDVYQKQAAESLQTQKDSVHQQEMLTKEMSDIKIRLGSIEKILKEVE